MYFGKNKYLNSYHTDSLSELTVYRVQSAILSGLILILIALTGWMKLVSYAHTNSDIRALVQAGEKVGLMWFQAVMHHKNRRKSSCLSISLGIRHCYIHKVIVSYCSWQVYREILKCRRHTYGEWPYFGHIILPIVLDSFFRIRFEM